MKEKRERKPQRIKQQRFLDNMYLHELRWLGDIYCFYGGTHSSLQAKRTDPLYQECRRVFQQLAKSGKIYKRGAYAGRAAGWYVKSDHVSVGVYCYRKYGDPIVE